MLHSRLRNHPRKPQDIIAFTDSFCYSACSVLTKSMVEKGDAIVVGFEGDPEGKLDEFDAGNSPTDLVSQNELFLPEADKLNKIGGYMGISMFETYLDDYNMNQTMPREFMIMPVNERVNVYKYDDSKLGLFIDQAISIHNKYKTQCDPKNKRLVKVDDACDSQMTIPHAHGGYLCGDDGKWTNTCVASYCDFGYKFDRYNNKCVVDACYNKTDESSAQSNNASDESIDSSDDDKTPTWVWVVIGVMCFVTIVIVLAIIIAIVVFSMRKKGPQYSAIK